MKEEHTGEVCLEGIDGHVMTAFLSFMYGKLLQIDDDMLVPLFALADVHQVRHCPGSFVPGKSRCTFCGRFLY